MTTSELLNILHGLDNGEVSEATAVKAIHAWLISKGYEAPE